MACPELIPDRVDSAISIQAIVFLIDSEIHFHPLVVEVDVTATVSVELASCILKLQVSHHDALSGLSHHSYVLIITHQFL